jgi:hypothetical protein
MLVFFAVARLCFLDCFLRFEVVGPASTLLDGVKESEHVGELSSSMRDGAIFASVVVAWAVGTSLSSAPISVMEAPSGRKL